MAFNETWLNASDANDKRLHIDGFESSIYLDRDPMLTGKKLGGCVCLYVNKSWCMTTVVWETLCNPSNCWLFHCDPFNLYNIYVKISTTFFYF